MQQLTYYDSLPIVAIKMGFNIQVLLRESSLHPPALQGAAHLVVRL